MNPTYYDTIQVVLAITIVIVAFGVTACLRRYLPH